MRGDTSTFFCITLLHTYVLLDVNILYIYRGLLFDVLDEFPISFQEHFVRNNSSIT